MTSEAMLKELEDACGTLSVQVTYEAIAASVGMGGLCRVKGQYRAIIDKRATPQERASTLAEAISQLETSALTLSPKVRELVDYYAARRGYPARRVAAARRAS